MGIVEKIVARALRESLRFTPRPSALVLRREFAASGRALAAELAPYEPDGIAARLDERYGEHPDALLDVYWPASAEAEGAAALPTVVWIHGGGWVGGSKEELRSYLKLIAARGFAVVGIRYPLAPEVHYPEPVRHAMAALRHVQDHAARFHADPTRILVAGDSAGAQITAQVAVAVNDPSYAAAIDVTPTLTPEQLRGVALCCGPFDVRQVDENSPMRWFFTTILWAYSGTREFRDDARFATFSVARYVGPTFPPAYLTVGNADPLVTHSHALAETLAAHGVEVDTLFFPPDRTPPLPHEYQFHLGEPAATESFERMVAFFTRHGRGPE
jgi:acetyl esterase